MNPAPPASYFRPCRLSCRGRTPHREILRPALLAAFRFLILVTVLGAFPALPARARDAASGATDITGIRAVGNQLLVTVRVPSGQRRLTLEARPRLQTGAWTPREVKWTDGSAGELTFSLPLGEGMEMVRIRDDAAAELGLPASFFTGLKTFVPGIQAANAAKPPGAGGGNVVFGGSDASPLLKGGPESANPRSVVESDIWKVDGRTLYFFNQQRGLQVINLADADHPRLTGTLPLAVWGEQLYRLPAPTTDGSVWLALLAQQGCAQGSEVLLVHVKDGNPTLATRLPVRGQIRETRLVGDVLYLATVDWFQPPSREIRDGKGVVTSVQPVPWENRTVLSAFDLANPAQPVARPSVEIAANPDAINATDRFLFVASTGSRTPVNGGHLPEWVVAGTQGVLIFDITDPHGVLRPAGFARTSGRVADKFKIGFNDGVLTTISQTDGGREVSHTNWFRPRRAADPVYLGDPVQIAVPAGQIPSDPAAFPRVSTTWEWVAPRTVLETFSLADPAVPTPLGQLTLVTNESLFATRLAGNRAYVVTFRRIDPLWIIDLSDPARPRVKGELQIPGYSTFLQPLADNTSLLALGVEGGRTMVQLFDVADPAKPSLRSKVTLGKGWSWSEGNSDEKAFQVFAGAGLVLVPWQGMVAGTDPAKWFQGIQLIDLDLAAGKLTARGVVDHAVQARRATLLGDRVISLSAQELLTVNAADRDHPAITAKLELSSQVDRVFVAGDRLLQIRDNGTLPPRIALTTVASPEVSLATLWLDPLPVVGTDLHDGRLFVLQLQPDSSRQDPEVFTKPEVTTIKQPPLRQPETNIVIELIQPPPLVSFAWWTNISTPPPLPWDPNPPVPRTNVFLRKFVTPQPPYLTTNELVSLREVPQPPLWVTNWIPGTNWVSVRVPGALQLSVVDTSATTLKVAGQVKLANPTNYYGGSLVALRPRDGLLVWTESNTGFQPYWGGGPGPNRWSVDGIGVNLQIRPGWWGGWGWWGSQSRLFLACDVTHPAGPVMASVTRLGDGADWNSFSEAFTADRKVFVSHDVTKFLPPSKGITLITNADNSVTRKPIILDGFAEQHHFLDVLDFSDPANPVVRPPIPFPGSLQGISHAGLLVYAEGQSQTDQKDTRSHLHALAYDGVQASLVASLPRPTTWPQPLLVRADGKVLVGITPATTNDVPKLETWAVSTAGKFEKYASITLRIPAQEFHPFGNLLIVPIDGAYQFWDATDATALHLRGVGERPCALWPDWIHSDASDAGGLWLPRGGQGLWDVPIQSAIAPASRTR